MGKKYSSTSIEYTSEHVGDVYNLICEALLNIEIYEKNEFDGRKQYCYKEATSRRWWNLWIKSYKGTYEEFEKEKFSSFELILKYNTRYKEMRKLHNLFADAISKNVTVHLSKEDHDFIEKWVHVDS